MNDTSDPLGLISEALGEPSFRLTYEDIKKARQPAVYAIIKATGDCYIGATSVGLSRPLAVNHHIHVESGDRLFVWQVEDGAKAFQAEGALLCLLKPSLNKQPGSYPDSLRKKAPNKPEILATRICPNCKRSFEPIRRWQVYCNPSCRFRAWVGRCGERTVRGVSASD